MLITKESDPIIPTLLPSFKIHYYIPQLSLSMTLAARFIGINAYKYIRHSNPVFDVRINSFYTDFPLFTGGCEPY